MKTEPGPDPRRRQVEALLRAAAADDLPPPPEGLAARALARLQEESAAPATAARSPWRPAPLAGAILAGVVAGAIGWLAAIARSPAPRPAPVVAVAREGAVPAAARVQPAPGPRDRKPRLADRATGTRTGLRFHRWGPRPLPGRRFRRLTVAGARRPGRPLAAPDAAPNGTPARPTSLAVAWTVEQGQRETTRLIAPAWVVGPQQPDGRRPVVPGLIDLALSAPAGKPADRGIPVTFLPDDQEQAPYEDATLDGRGAGGDGGLGTDTRAGG